MLAFDIATLPRVALVALLATEHRTAGICAGTGKPLTFGGRLRCGLLLTAGQLVMAAGHVLALFRILH